MLFHVDVHVPFDDAVAVLVRVAVDYPPVIAASLAAALLGYLLGVPPTRVDADDGRVSAWNSS